MRSKNYRRGRYEIYFDIIESCPRPVYRITKEARINYRVLVDALELGLVEWPRIEDDYKRQIVRRTEKGEKYRRAFRDLLRIVGPIM